MFYHEFKGKKISALGFGTMRLPVRQDGTIDEPQVAEMTRIAMENGVNYFDTAYPYHSGESERVIGRALRAYPRDSFYLATKFPGHQISDTYEPEKVFEHQLEKCGVDYFDFYLLHNVYENSIGSMRIRSGGSSITLSNRSGAAGSAIWVFPVMRVSRRCADFWTGTAGIWSSARFSSIIWTGRCRTQKRSMNF